MIRTRTEFASNILKIQEFLVRYAERRNIEQLAEVTAEAIAGGLLTTVCLVDPTAEPVLGFPSVRLTTPLIEGADRIRCKATGSTQQGAYARGHGGILAVIRQIAAPIN